MVARIAEVAGMWTFFFLKEEMWVEKIAHSVSI